VSNARSRRAVNLLLLCALTVSSVQAYRFCWPQQLYAHVHNRWTGDTDPGNNLWLPDYTVVIDAKPVEPGLQNLSGITYDFDQDRLLAITNKYPMEVLVLSKTGEINGRYPLEGFDDSEGLAYMGQGRLAIADESKQSLHVVTLPAEPGAISISQAQTVTLQINLSASNKGFEGVTYDVLNDRMFAIKERDPRQILAVTGMLRSLQGALNITVTDLTAWVDQGVYARDLSDASFDPRTQHMLVLSDQSKNITELDSQGKFVSIRSLRGLFSDLAHDAPQAEGMTLDKQGDLYVLSEPNLFYRFRKTPKS
jgi:uncharacterized protein YjiK